MKLKLNFFCARPPVEYIHREKLLPPNIDMFSVEDISSAITKLESNLANRVIQLTLRKNKLITWYEVLPWEYLERISCLDNEISALGLSINLAREDSPQDLIFSYFGLKEDGELINLYPVGWGMDDIAVFLKLFTSKAEAKKNGWAGEIPEGFTEKLLKKQGKRVYIYSPPKAVLND